jgi:hypothetical protein
MHFLPPKPDGQTSAVRPQHDSAPFEQSDAVIERRTSSDSIVRTIFVRARDEDATRP